MEHINLIANKISRTVGPIGVINQLLKNYIPEKVLLTIYNTLILPHLNYGKLIQLGY